MEKVICARVPDGLADRLALEAKRQLTDQSTLIRRALADYLGWTVPMPEESTVGTYDTKIEGQ